METLTILPGELLAARNVFLLIGGYLLTFLRNNKFLILGGRKLRYIIRFFDPRESGTPRLVILIMRAFPVPRWPRQIFAKFILG